ncbi:MAG: S66 peptidase family protein [Candidatus Woesearchaeota archaeon]
MIKPKRLKKGDTVAFVAPASGFAAIVSHRLDKAKQFFEKEGYNVKIYPSATKNEGFSSDTAQNRAKDINDAFENSDIKAIITTIGGNSSHQILEYLDFEMIKKNPKIFCGYSDITSMHFAFITQCEMISFYGPSAVCEFGETLDLEEFTTQYFFKAVCETSNIGKILPSNKWTDSKNANWLNKEDLHIYREYKENRGYEWLREGSATGVIMGGCITSMMHTKGTKYWPSFKDSILLLETPEGEEFDKGESVANVDSYLSDLRILGIFDEIKGIVFGRGFGYTDDEIQQLKDSIIENTRGYDFPIVYGVDIGHSDPMLTIPLGVKVSLDSKTDLFSIDESGVE